MFYSYWLSVVRLSPFRSLRPCSDPNLSSYPVLLTASYHPGSLHIYICSKFSFLTIIFIGLKRDTSLKHLSLTIHTPFGRQRQRVAATSSRAFSIKYPCLLCSALCRSHVLCLLCRAFCRCTKVILPLPLLNRCSITAFYCLGFELTLTLLPKHFPPIKSCDNTGHQPVVFVPHCYFLRRLVDF